MLPNRSNARAALPNGPDPVHCRGVWLDPNVKSLWVNARAAAQALLSEDRQLAERARVVVFVVAERRVVEGERVERVVARIVGDRQRHRYGESRLPALLFPPIALG